MAQKNEILYVNFYTDGSAAKKIAPAFPEMQPRKKAHAKRAKRRVIHVDPVAFGSLMVAAMLLVMMAVGLTKLQSVQAERIAMENYLQQLQEEYISLDDTFREEVDLEAVEKTAEVLGMVPRPQVASTPIQVEQSQLEVAEPTLWGQIYAFLTNLFA